MVGFVYPHFVMPKEEEEEEDHGIKAKDLNGAIAPTVLIKDKTLTPGQKIVWLAIRDREGSNDRAWPSLTTIADDCNLSRMTVVTATAALKKQGWLKIENTDSSNIYECWIPKKYQTNVKEHPKGGVVKKLYQGSQKIILAGGSQKIRPKPIQSNEGIKNQHTEQPSGSPTAPAAEAPKKPRVPNQPWTVALEYLRLRGDFREGEEPPASVVKRHLRDAKDLLASCGGDPANAVAFLGTASRFCASRDWKDWTIGTALKHFSAINKEIRQTLTPEEAERITQEKFYGKQTG